MQATNQELGTALRLERNMTKELEALGLLKDEFVSTVSHELRTPLASIVGYAEVLEDGNLAGLGEDEHQMLRTIDQNGHRLLVLVEDLLTIGQIESGTFGSIQRAVDLGALLEACRNSVLPDAKSKGIHLGLSVGPGVGTIITDPVQLDRLVLNLLTNALKFTPRSGHVEIAARLEAGAAVIEVCDDGVGIPLADQGEVFSRFFRSRRSFEDTVPGIGMRARDLEIDRGRARRMHLAHIGTGRRYHRDRGAAVLRRRPARSRRSPAAPLGENHRRMNNNIALVVDDDDDLRALLTFKLLHSGFEVHGAPDGTSGLAAIVDLRPAIVLLDWMMPTMTGLEVCAQLREVPWRDRDARHPPHRQGAGARHRAWVRGGRRRLHREALQPAS